MCVCAPASSPPPPAVAASISFQCDKRDGTSWHHHNDSPWIKEWDVPSSSSWQTVCVGRKREGGRKRDRKLCVWVDWGLNNAPNGSPYKLAPDGWLTSLLYSQLCNLASLPMKTSHHRDNPNWCLTSTRAIDHHFRQGRTGRRKLLISWEQSSRTQLVLGCSASNFQQLQQWWIVSL